VETVSCQSSTSSPSSDRSQESPLFHNYSDLKSSPGTLVYIPSWFRLWDSDQPDTQQGKADALSRRSEYELRAGDEAYGQQNQTLLNPEQFRVATTISTLLDSYLVRDIKMATEEDTWATNIKKELQERLKNPNRDDLDQFEQQDGLLLRNNLIYVLEGPIRLKILKECHNNTLAGHFGIARTHELVSRTYWWPKMNKLLREYVKSCDTCARSKAPRHRPFGFLQPLSIPSRPWGSIAMDFITDLPTVRTKNSILVVVDRLTKMAYFTLVPSQSRQKRQFS
jgi:hypothetical protein